MSVSRPANPLPSLDGLRAASFLSVFLSHAGLPHWKLAGDSGLAVFFVLSGFLITTLLRQEYELTGSVSLSAFYARRALRILPPLLLALTMAVGVALFVYPSGTLKLAPVIAVVLNATNYWLAVFGGYGMAAGTERYWSLAVEEHFYLLYPVLYRALRRKRLSGSQQGGVFLGLCGLMLLWRCVLVYVIRVPDNYIALATETRGDMLLFGCALAAGAHPALDPTRLSEIAWKWTLVPLCIAAMGLSVLWHDRHFHLTWYYTLQGVALSGLLSAAVRFPQWPLFRWLNWRPIAFIGLLSYTLYLIHDVSLRALAQEWPQQPTAVRTLVALLSSMLLALGMYRVVERPCGRLRSQLRAGLTRQAAAIPTRPCASAIS